MRAQCIDTLHAAAEAFMNRERHHDAKHVFRTMLFLDATDPRGWLGLAGCYAALGDSRTAAELHALGERLTR